MTDERHAAKQPAPPRLPPELEPAEDEIAPRSELDGRVVSNLDLGERDASGSTWERVQFNGTNLAGADLTHLTLVDARLDDVDLANTEAAQSMLARAEVNGGRMLGAGLLEARLRDVVFTGVQLDFARLRGAHLERVRFVDCQLRDADLSLAKLESVVFEDCDLARADISRATFTRCELRGCMLDGVRGLTSLAGMSIPLPDVMELAPTLARAFGAHVV